MKTKINTLPSVIAAVKENIESQKQTLEYLMQLSASLGLSQAAGSATQHSANGAAAPHGMSAQVIQILSESGRPMMPKNIVNRHQELGWPAPAGGRAKLYEAVSGSLSYLLNRKGVLTKTKKGYSIKQEEKE